MSAGLILTILVIVVLLILLGVSIRATIEDGMPEPLIYWTIGTAILGVVYIFGYLMGAGY